MKPDDIDGSIPVGDEQAGCQPKRSRKKKEAQQLPETVADAYARLSAQMKKEHAAIHRNIRMGDAVMHSLVNLVNAHYGIGDMDTALRDATILVEKHNYIRYAEDQVSVRSDLLLAMHSLMPEQAPSGGSKILQETIASILKEVQKKCPSHYSGVFVKVQRSILASVIYGPLAHHGQLPTQPYYEVMQEIRSLLTEEPIHD